jgi:hypothetical protein
MLLLSEDIYNELMTKHTTIPDDNKYNTSSSSSGIVKTFGGDQQLIGQTRDRLSKLTSSLIPPLNKSKKGWRGDADSKEIAYNREFKRYSKLMKDQMDKPVNVKMIESSIAGAAAVPTSTSAFTSPKRRQTRRSEKQQQQQQSSSSIRTNKSSSSNMSSTESEGDDDEGGEKQSPKIKVPTIPESKKDARPRRENRSQRKKPYIPSYYPDKYSTTAAGTSTKQQKGKGVKGNKKNVKKIPPAKIIHKNRTQAVNKSSIACSEHFKPQLWKFYYY